MHWTLLLVLAGCFAAPKPTGSACEVGADCEMGVCEGGICTGGTCKGNDTRCVGVAGYECVTFEGGVFSSGTTECEATCANPYDCPPFFECGAGGDAPSPLHCGYTGLVIDWMPDVPIAGQPTTFTAVLAPATHLRAGSEPDWIFEQPHGDPTATGARVTTTDLEAGSVTVVLTVPLEGGDVAQTELPITVAAPSP